VVTFLRWLPPIGLGLAIGWFSPTEVLAPFVLGVFVLVAGWMLLYPITRVACVRLVGFRPLLVRVGPLAAVATTAGWRLALTTPRSVAGSQHDAGTSGPVSVGWLRSRCAVLLLVQPATLAGLTVLVLAAAVLSGSHVLWLVALFAALLVLDNLVPWPRGAGFGPSAGWWLWSWLVRPDGTAQRTAVYMLWLQLVLHYGQRPGLVHESWVGLAAGPAAEATSSEDADGSRLAYFWALDRGDVVMADACIRRAIGWTYGTGTPQEQAAVIEAAFLAARYQDDVERAERLLAGMTGSVDAALADDLARAQAAIHLARRQFEEALACCEVALEPVPTRMPLDIVLLRRTQGTGEPTGGHAVFHRDQLRRIRDAAHAALHLT